MSRYKKPMSKYAGCNLFTREATTRGHPETQGGKLRKPRHHVVKELQSIVGPANVIYHPENLLVFKYDGSIDRAIPESVVFPATTEEVSRVVSLAYRKAIPVVGRGSGTGLSGGAIAIMGGASR